MGDFEDVARELRQGAGREWREEAALDEALTELQRRRRRDLAQVARQAMYRGDRVTARVGGLVLTHPLAAVGSDYMTMATDSGAADIRLELAVVEVVAQSVGGTSRRADPATFRARLTEHEQHDDRIVVRTGDGIEASGALEVAAADHLVMRSEDGVLSYLPIARVAVVFSPRRPRRE